MYYFDILSQVEASEHKNQKFIINFSVQFLLQFSKMIKTKRKYISEK